MEIDIELISERGKEEHEIILNPHLDLQLTIKAPVKNRGIQNSTFRIRADTIEKLIGTAAEILNLKRSGKLASTLSEEKMKGLFDTGIFVEKIDVPKRGELVCSLDEKSMDLIPINRKLTLAGAPFDLILNPFIIVQNGFEIPKEVSSLNPFLAKLDFGRDVIWVTNPESIPLPFSITGTVGEIVSDLIVGKVRPSELSAKVTEILRHATILIEKNYFEIQSSKLRLAIENARTSLKERSYFVLRDIINPIHLANFRAYYRKFKNEGFLNVGDDQVLLRDSVHNEALVKSIHLGLANLLNRILPKKVKPSYVYLSVYKPGAVLEKHVDRPQCEWNMSVVLDMGPTRNEEVPWPIFLEIEKKAEEVLLDFGDSVVYEGTKIPHWRDALPEGHECTVAFYHFVDADFSGDLN